MNSPRAPRLLLSATIVVLTLATAFAHVNLGGTLFLLNALGYLGLGAIYLVAVAVPVPAVQRFSWVPRVALAGYAAITIVAFLVSGPYFLLGWLTKGIEIALILAVMADLLIGADAGAAHRPMRGA